jgi:regulatory protein YycI of two-component signal transduction system YycFG
MDWSRAKTVLIWAFLFLNVLLGYQLWMDELNLNTFSENAVKRDEMNRLLSLKDIRLDASIPEGTPILSEITVSLQTGELPKEPVRLKRPFSRTLVNDFTLVRSSLEKNIPEVDAYQPDPYAVEAGGPDYVMNQLHGDLPMFEMRVELFAEDDEMVSYRYAYSEVEPTSATPPKGQEVLSAYITLGSLAENYLPQGAVVSDVRLGYHGPIFESETQVLAPYWRIVLSTGETYFVHAVNGAVEGPSSQQKRKGDNQTQQ